MINSKTIKFLTFSASVRIVTKMKAFIAFGLIYSVLGQREVQYGLNGNCGNNYPECETYFDGCNECTCEVGDSSSSACTES